MRPRGGNALQGLFLLGFCTLLVEMIWARQWGLIVGSDSEGIALALGLFLAGGALGMLVAACARWSARTCAWLTLGGVVGGSAYGLAVMAASPGWLLLEHPAGRLCVAAPLLLASAGFGASVPAWFLAPLEPAGNGDALGSRGGTPRSTGAAMQQAGLGIAALDLGSAGGALATPLLVLPSLGPLGGLGVAVALLTVLAWLAPSVSLREGIEPRSTTHAPSLAVRLCLAGGCGVVAFALQVVWTRLLGEVLGTTLLVLGLATACSLGAGAVGCWLMPRLAQRWGRADLLVLGVMGWVVAQALALYLVACLPDFYLWGARYLPVEFPLGGWRLILVLMVLFPGAALGGFLVPLLTGGWSEPGALARQTGWHQATALAAGALGALGAGLAWIPGLGSRTTLVVLAAGTAVLALGAVSLARREHAGQGRILVTTAILLALALGIGSAGYRQWDDAFLGAGVFQWSREDVESGEALIGWRSRTILHTGEGRLARVNIEAAPDHNTVYLRVGGRVEGTVPMDDTRPSLADLPTELLLGVLPYLERGAETRTLVLGVGGGTTLAAAVETLGPQWVWGVEVEAEVLRALRGPGGREGLPWEHERLFRGAAQPTVWIADGRAVLHRGRGAPWDAVVSQPSEPWLPWSAPLFTREFFALVKARLAPGGVAIHWLQLYRIGFEDFAAILQAFRAVHERVRVFHPPDTGEVLLVGGGEPVPLEVWAQRWGSPAAQACWRRMAGGGGAPAVPILDGPGVDRWLAGRLGRSHGMLRERLEFHLPLAADRGIDHAGEILRSLRAIEGTSRP